MDMDTTVGRGFAKDHLNELRYFLYDAQQQGYGGTNRRGKRMGCEVMPDGGTKQTFETGVIEQTFADGGTKIIWEDSDFRYSDKYFGGEPFGGMTVVRYHGKACYVMVYHGTVLLGVEKDLVYCCLKKALMEIDEELPVRGPSSYKMMVDDICLEYQRTISGDLTQYSGKETISTPSGLLYEATFTGGLVNLR